jgi:hypothetical protein
LFIARSAANDLAGLGGVGHDERREHAVHGGSGQCRAADDERDQDDIGGARAAGQEHAHRGHQEARQDEELPGAERRAIRGC